MEGLLSFVLGVMGNITAVLIFLSPISTFCRIIKHKSTEEFESLPYICTLLSASLWSYYAFNRSGEYLLATINVFGVVIEAAYLILFLIYAPPRMKLRTGILLGVFNVGFVGAVIVATQLALEAETRINTIGFMCAGLQVLMFASPLAAMKTVVRRNSVEYMPFWLSFFCFLNGAAWFSYAMALHDYFLGVSNGIGFSLATAQLVLYAIYKDGRRSRGSTAKGTSSTGLEEGLLQHQNLVSPSNGLQRKDDQS